MGLTEAALQGTSYEKVFWKYAANLQENPHAEVRSKLDGWQGSEYVSVL